MNFIYHKDAKSPILTIDGELYQYLFKVRRTSNSEVLNFRNLIDFNIYSYKIVNISKKEATLSLNNYYEHKLEPKSELHIGWCVIEPKNIEKVLPSLNEIGVSKISLFYCARSQKVIN